MLKRFGFEIPVINLQNLASTREKEVKRVI